MFVFRVKIAIEQTIVSKQIVRHKKMFIRSFYVQIVENNGKQ